MILSHPRIEIQPALDYRDKGAIQGLLALWTSRGWLRELDRAFADFLWEEAPDAHPLLILAAALASHQLGRGHACLDLAATHAQPGLVLSIPPEGDDAGQAGLPPAPEALVRQWTLAEWQAALNHPDLVSEGPGNTPLVLSGSRFYLRRYWQYEQRVREELTQRLGRNCGTPSIAPVGGPMADYGDVPPLPTDRLRPWLDWLFPQHANTEGQTDWQKIACALAARNAFTIITGGPGTGKTTTVVRLLAVLQALKLGNSAHDIGAFRPLRIRLAAPTGKAAARLNESIAKSIQQLPLVGFAGAEAIRTAIPVKVSTLHRLLGSRPDTRRFRHHAGNLLALDVLVIDEASMVDLEMMAAVLEALPRSAKLILLGDKDQLASVEAGAVLGELCQRARDGHYLPATVEWLRAVTGQPIESVLIDEGGTGFDQSVVMLRHSHRFASGSGVGQLASVVNEGDVVAAEKIFREGRADLAWLRISEQDDDAFRTLVLDGGSGAGATAHLSYRPENASGNTRQGYRHYLETMRYNRPGLHSTQQDLDEWARSVLRAHGRFQLLCALRKGPWGVEGLNRRIADLLAEAGLIPRTGGWYAGRPVLITRNDYGLGLMNGDIGITLPLANALGEADGLRVAFSAGDASQGIKWAMPSRLQSVETVYALTVHKSQGSEFEHVALVLPDRVNPILTRELLYTGITRAREVFTLISTGDRGVLEAAITHRVLRHSGLQPLAC